MAAVIRSSSVSRCPASLKTGRTTVTSKVGSACTAGSLPARALRGKLATAACRDLRLMSSPTVRRAPGWEAFLGPLPAKSTSFA